MPLRRPGHCELRAGALLTAAIVPSV